MRGISNVVAGHISPAGRRFLTPYFKDLLTNSGAVVAQAPQPVFAGKGADTSSSLHDTKTENLAPVQCECIPANKISLQQLYQLIGI